MHDIKQQTITLLQTYIRYLGFNAHVHFELEGCYSSTQEKKLNFPLINQQLKQLNIDGELVAEYWKNQWEYVSFFAGQSPLEEANNLVKVMRLLPELFRQQGIDTTLIKPVIWHGDSGKLVKGSKNIFSQQQRSVHIPNAIQLNISATDQSGDNLIVKQGFGEYLQQNFLQTSHQCALLYLPEEDAYERLKLKDKYGLAQELCSPIDISGGHQGSIALYKKVGKHNQLMGETPLLIDQHSHVILSQVDWQKTARIEHRLGAASAKYNPYSNVIFALLNLVDALHVYRDNACVTAMSVLPKSQPLPSSLYDQQQELGAISLFKAQTWFSAMINSIHLSCKEKLDIGHDLPNDLGERIKQNILDCYQN